MRRQVLGGLLICVVSITLGRQRANVSVEGTHQHASAQSGAIAGRVLDPDGQPLSRAAVYAERSDFTTGKRPFTYTDDRGRFVITSIAPGSYSIYAAKEDDGYPPTDSFFHSVDSVKAPQVTVYEGKTTSDVVIQLGPKVGRLIGQIVDAKTKESIVSAQIVLTRVDNPDTWYSTGPDLNGEFNVLVPPVPITINVSASGYRYWYYWNKGAKDQADSLNVVPDTIKHLTVSLLSNKHE